MKEKVRQLYQKLERKATRNKTSGFIDKGFI